MKKLFLGLLLTTSLSAGAAEAAGFYIQEQSVSGMGRSFAGEPAAAADASTVFFNPAGMTQLGQAQVHAGLHVLVPSSEITNERSTNNVSGSAVANTGGLNHASGYDPAAVPNLFIAYPIMQNLWVGYGATAPFGLASDYGQTWFGRYDSTSTRLRVVNHSVAVAYEPVSWLSVGAALDYQDVDAKLERAAFTGGADAIVQLKGSDSTIGWDAGLLLKPTESLKIGAHYRSAITNELEGRVRTSVSGSLISNQVATADLDLPDIASIGVDYVVNPEWNVMAGVNWFGWSNFEEIRVKRTGVADDVTTQGYEDTFAFSLGAEHKYDQNWTLRSGIQYDQTPTTDEFRTSRTPDGNRTWLSIGASYEFEQAPLVLDLAATHIMIDNGSIDVTRTGASSILSSSIRAKTGGSVDIFAAGLTYKF